VIIKLYKETIKGDTKLEGLKRKDKLFPKKQKKEKEKG